MDGVETPHEALARLLSSTHRDWVRLCVPIAAVDDIPDFDHMDEAGREYWLALADGMMESNYRKLEPVWAETLQNDGVYEYTTSGSCDGSEIWNWYRRPMMQAVKPASPWEMFEHRVVGTDA